MSYSNDMFREIILDHVENPRNKNKKHDNYNKVILKNPSCGDIVTVYSILKNNKIEDITYEVTGCSICNASTSIMSELLIGKTVEESETIIDNFNKMITNQEYNEDILGEAIALKGVSTIPSRIKCASLCYKAFLETITVKGGAKNEK